MFWKDGLSKKFALVERCYFFFPENIIYFSSDEKWIYVQRCYKRGVALLPKKTKVTLSRKNALKGDISGVAEKR